jgi:iron complex outermembrane receptor protein
MNFNRNHDSAYLLAAVSLAAIALSSTPAFAQEATAPAAAPAETQYDDDAIVVIGITKQAANIQDVPVSITAFSGDSLEDKGIKEVGEIAKFTPGFNIRGSGNNPTAFALSMRGQVQNDNLATLEPSVGVYLDEMYIARSYGLNVDLLDVASVQILKGPQGTLFGRNTSAGAVLIQTADPEMGEFSGRVSATYGRFDERSITGVVNAGLGDNLAVRGALFYGKRDGYKTDVRTGRKYEARETLNGRVKLAYEPTENLSILLSGEWYDGKIDGPARQNLFFRLTNTVDPAAPDRALFGGDPDLVAVTNPALVPGAPARGIHNDVKTQTYIAKVTLESDIGQFRFINGYRQIKGNNLLDLDGSSQVTGNHFTQGIQNLKQYSSELQLTGKTDSGLLDYAVGFTYFKETGLDISRSSTNGSAVWSGFSGDIDNDSMGVYAQTAWHITDKLSLNLGARYSVDDKGVTTQSAAFPNNGTVFAACLPNPAQLVNGQPIITPTQYAALVANNCERGRRDDFSNVSYTAGFDYKLTDDILFFAKHSKGYRSGAQQLRTLTLTDTMPAQPEIVYEQEVGLKTQFWDKRVTFNVAGYHNVVKGAQRSVILSVNGIQQTILENADTETWGMEADLNVEVADGLNIFGSGSITDPKYTRYDGFASLGGTLVPDDKSDTMFTGIVKKQFAVGASYDGDLGFARLKVNASYAWQGKMYQTEQTIDRLIRPTSAVGGSGFTQAQAEAAIAAATTRAHGITNARAALAFGPNDNYEVAVWGRNIFDERATQYSLFLAGLNYVGTSWNEPATYGVTATVRF